jgi:hypothetical protein
MAIYGFRFIHINRCDASVAQAISYLCRLKLYDKYHNKTHYHNHLKDLLNAEIMLFPNAPPEYDELETLCYEMEKAEKRYDSRIARAFRVSLPNEKDFTLADLKNTASNFVNENFINLGLCVIIAIHAGENIYDPTKNNPHAHILASTREADRSGFKKCKNRELDKKISLLKLRKSWENVINREYKRKNLPQRVSCESNEVQGNYREPTIPLGRESTALEKRGIKTPRGNKNREIEQRNEARQKQKELELERLLEQEQEHEFELSR